MLYPQVSELLSFENILQVEGNLHRDWQLVNKEQKRYLRVFSTKWDIYIASVSSRFRDVCRREERRVFFKSQRQWKTSRKWCFPDTTGKIHT